MKITRRQIRRIVETAAGRNAARASMERNYRASKGHDVDFEDWLQDTYSDIDDYFNGGYDEEGGRYGHGAWVVYDEVEGKFVDSGVKENSPIGKLKAYHYINGREIKDQKALQKSYQMMENKMKITRRQLRQIIKEAIDVMDSSTGELLVFDDEAADEVGVPRPDAPEAAALDIMRRLGIKSQPDPQYSDDVPTYVVSSDDYEKMHQELYGKRAARKSKADKKRLDIVNLMDRVQVWAMQAGREYLADNRGGRLEDIAFDLAQAAEMEFKPDEWNELLYHFEFEEDDLRMYIADVIAMQDE